MGLLDKLTGTAKPEDGVTARPAPDVLAALQAVGAPDKPYVIHATDEEGADLVAEWRVDEPAWGNALQQRKVDRLIKVFMRLDADDHEVRNVQKTYTVTWKAGVAELSLSKEATRGSGRTVSFGKTIGGDGDGPEWSFDSDDLVDPLKQAALDNGWGWKAVSFGKL